MCFGAGREGCHLLVTRMNPLDLTACANRIRDAVERIAADAVDSLNSGFH
jgi:hypothetical protein